MTTAYLTIAAAADRYGRSKSAFREAVRRGRLPAIKPGREWLVTVEDAATGVVRADK